MTPTKHTLVSLGMSCQSAHQLALFAEKNPKTVNFIKGPFDWLICPPAAAANWLESGLIDFKTEEIVERRAHAYWPKFDFWFWHGFMDRNRETRTLDISANMHRELEKLSYQRSIFKTLDPASTVFVFSNTQNNLTTEVFEPCEEDNFRLTTAAMTQVQKSLDSIFGSPTQLHWMTRKNLCEINVIDQLNVHLLPPEASDWKGCPDDWNQVLRRIIGL